MIEDIDFPVLDERTIIPAGNLSAKKSTSGICAHSVPRRDILASRFSGGNTNHTVGISPKMAQTLARHSDIRLTLQVYTHVDLHDQTAAILALPGPPRSANAEPVRPLRKIGT